MGEHGHAHPHRHVSAHNPHAGQGPVVLDIGETTGALVLHAREDMVGREIDISPAGHDTERRHVEVLARATVGGTRYVAVYDAVPQGRWALWGLDGQPVLTVEVVGGAVVEARWPDGQA